MTANTNDVAITIDANIVDDTLCSLLADYEAAHLALDAYSIITHGTAIYYPGYMNLRDVITHLHGVLSPGKSILEQYAELVCAREHVRRAVTETYQNLFDRRYKEAFALYTEYLKAYAPFESKIGYFSIDHDRYAGIFKTAKEHARFFRHKKSQGDGWQEYTTEMKEQIDIIEGVAAEVKTHLESVTSMMTKKYGEKLPLI